MLRSIKTYFFLAVMVMALGFSPWVGAAEMADQAAAPAAPAAEKKAPMMDEAMMAKWKEAASPNEHHKILEPLVGNWEYSMKMWMTPDAPPEESSGTQSTQWVMDGRFIEQTADGESMGQPFHGQGITGYDNGTQQYMSVWYDNMATWMMISSGTYDAAAKKLTMNGAMVCPIKGPMTFRWVTTITGPDSYTFECFTTQEGKEFQSMEIKFKRKA